MNLLEQIGTDIEIRQFEERDYDAVVAVSNAVVPDRPWTVDELRYEDDHLDRGKYMLERHVARRSAKRGSRRVRRSAPSPLELPSPEVRDDHPRVPGPVGAWDRLAPLGPPAAIAAGARGAGGADAGEGGPRPRRTICPGAGVQRGHAEVGLAARRRIVRSLTVPARSGARGRRRRRDHNAGPRDGQRPELPARGVRPGHGAGRRRPQPRAVHAGRVYDLAPPHGGRTLVHP